MMYSDSGAAEQQWARVERRDRSPGGGGGWDHDRFKERSASPPAGHRGVSLRGVLDEKAAPGGDWSLRAGGVYIKPSSSGDRDGKK